jgi:RRXRR protein
MQFVPVVDVQQRPLMPTTANRAARWIRSRKATPFWKRGVFCVRLNVELSAREAQPIAVGIDPGSKREGFTAKSAAHTYLNIQATAVDWVKDAVEVRRNMRRARRFRKTPCRANRRNRSIGNLPPSTRARWQWKLRLATWLTKMYPITAFVVEDIKVGTRKDDRFWNVNFSPILVGKRWFYRELGRLGAVETRTGQETKELREKHSLAKSTSSKVAEKFDVHCVDSWVLANWITGGHEKPDNTRLLIVTPLRFHRRQLHRLQPECGGIRARYGGTRSNGFKRGSLVKYPKLGVVYVGGFQNNRISLHAVESGKRVTKAARLEQCRFLTYNTWRARLLRLPEGSGSRRA